MSAAPRDRADAARPARPYDRAAVEIRLAGPRLRRACLAIDDGYTSARVWQAVTSHLDDPTGALALLPGDAGDTPFSVTFQPLRLPRPIHEPGLRAQRLPDARLAAWDAASCLLLIGPARPTPPPPAPADDAAEEEAPAPEIWGYVVLNAVPGARLAWIAELAITPAQRRRGLGRLLLEAGRAWARAPLEQGGAGGLPVLMVEISPRNYPAIAFYRRRGFHFAGYTDYTLAGGDLRLFFIRPTD